MRKDRTRKFINLMFVSVCVLAMLLSATTATAASNAPEKKPYVGYSKFEAGGIGYKEFGDLRAAVYGAIKETGAEAYPLDYIASKTGLSKGDIADRITRLVEKEYVAPIMTFDVNSSMFFPYYVYYVAIKLKADATAAQKDALTQKIRDHKAFCTSYVVDGDFDYWVGWHIESWESWFTHVYQPLLTSDLIEKWILLPSSAQVRHGMYNSYPVSDIACEIAYPSNFDALPKITNGKVTADDVKIIKAWNTKLPLEKQFNWDKVSKISGKSKDELISTLGALRENKILVGPFWGFNWSVLGVDRRFFFVELKNGLPNDKRTDLIYDFAAVNDFNLIYFHNDSLIKFTLVAPEGLADIDQCRNKIQSICGDYLVNIYEAKEVQQLRWWTLLWYPENFYKPGGVYIYKDK